MTECKLVSLGYVYKFKFDDEKCNKIWLDNCKKWKVTVFDAVARSYKVLKTGIIGVASNFYSIYHAKESNINRKSYV